MSTIWFTADLHFGHRKVAEIRGFEDDEFNPARAEEVHDEAVFQSWARVVRPKDTVYVLGDISGGSRWAEDYALGFLSILPGEKHLIAGNHDSVASVHRNGYKHVDAFRGVFTSVRDFARIRVQRQDILLSHYPYAYEGDGKDRESKTRYEQFRLPFLGAPLIHGHTHSTVAETDELQYCVSWDAHRGMVPLSKIEDHFFGEGNK